MSECFYRIPEPHSNLAVKSTLQHIQSPFVPAFEYIELCPSTNYGILKTICMLLTLEFICVSARLPSYNYSHFMSWKGNKQIYDRIKIVIFLSRSFMMRLRTWVCFISSLSHSLGYIQISKMRCCFDAESLGCRN